MDKYYFIANKEKRGPITPEEFATSPVNKSTLVWKEGMSNWLRIEQVPELQNYIAKIPPTLPHETPNKTIECIKEVLLRPNLWRFYLLVSIILSGIIYIGGLIPDEKKLEAFRNYKTNWEIEHPILKALEDSLFTFLLVAGSFLISSIISGASKANNPLRQEKKPYLVSWEMVLVALISVIVICTLLTFTHGHR